jgi:hypothetical protein
MGCPILSNVRILRYFDILGYPSDHILVEVHPQMVVLWTLLRTIPMGCIPLYTGGYHPLGWSAGDHLDGANVLQEVAQDMPIVQ